MNNYTVNGKVKNCEKELFDCIPLGTIVDVWFVAGFVRGTFNGVEGEIVIITKPLTATAYSADLNASLPLGPMRILLKYVTAVSPAAT